VFKHIVSVLLEVPFGGEDGLHDPIFIDQIGHAFCDRKKHSFQVEFLGDDRIRVGQNWKISACFSRKFALLLQRIDGNTHDLSAQTLEFAALATQSAGRIKRQIVARKRPTFDAELDRAMGLV
jgi:hypothetical protein